MNKKLYKTQKRVLEEKVKTFQQIEQELKTSLRKTRQNLKQACKELNNLKQIKLEI